MTKKQLVDNLLHEMAISAEPEQTFTYQQIGDYVGLSHERIRQIEQGALKKVKTMFTKMAKREGVM